MKAFALTFTGPRIVQCDEPQMGPAEIRIRVRACALNRVDLAMMHGAVHGRSGGVGAVIDQISGSLINQTIDLDAAQSALAHMQANRHFGKIVLRL